MGDMAELAELWGDWDFGDPSHEPANWRTKEGRWVEVSSMTDQHLLYSDRMVREKPGCFSQEIRFELLDEIVTRGLKRLPVRIN